MSIFLESLKFESNCFHITSKIIKLNGPDAAQYLNSQTTNNISKIEIGKFQINSILDLSGKLISSFIVCKESESDLILILDESTLESTIERLEKFHISEDFEISTEDKKYYIETNAKSTSGYSGSYFFEGDRVFCDESNQKTVSADQINILRIMTGVPSFGSEAKPGELINNTLLDNLSVDYTKGCYPGQETVAKIDTRRGAAYKPVLFITNATYNISIGDTLKVRGKKIGTILNLVTLKDQSYLMVSMGREYRIDKSLVEDCAVNEIFLSGTVHYYPYIATTKKDKAVELYDYAVELFHNSLYDQAISYFEKAMIWNPNFEDAYESLGVLYGRLENYDKAIELMEKLKTINPKCMMAFTNLSLYHMKIGNIDIAEKYKADATILNFNILGDEAERKNKEREIEQRRLVERDRREGMFQQVLEMDADDAMANNGMGEIMNEKERYDIAAEFFKKAIETDKKYSVAYLGVAKSLYNQSKIEECKTFLKLGIEVASKNGDLMPANEMQSLLQKIS